MTDKNLMTTEPVNQANTSVSNEMAKAVNDLFKDLCAAFPAWKNAFPNPEMYKSARKVWLETLLNEQITVKQVQCGLVIAKRSESPFFPSVGQFISWCKSEVNAEYRLLGLPTEDEALTRFRSYMGFAKYDEASFRYRSKAEYWFYRETYKRYAMRPEPELLQGLPKVLAETAEKARNGFDFPDIPRVIENKKTEIEPEKFLNNIANLKAILRRNTHKGLLIAGGYGEQSKG